MAVLNRITFFTICGFCMFGSLQCESSKFNGIERKWNKCTRQGLELNCTGLPSDIPNGVTTVHLKNIYVPNRVLTRGAFLSTNWEHVTKLVITADNSRTNMNNPVGVFDSLCFNGLKRLEILHIDISTTVVFRPDTLIGIPNLKLLDLSGCRRFDIDFLISALNNTKAVPNLRSLNLSLLNTYHTGIRLENNFFELISAKGIKELDLSSIQVLFMNLTSFKENCNTLEFMNISRMMLNDYEIDDHPSFCPNLKRLDASYITLPSTLIPDRGPQTLVVANKSVPLFLNLIPYFRSVEYFNLAGLMVKQTRYILKNVTFYVVGISKFNLKTLVLRDNRFERLDLRVIAKKFKLESIDLSQCNIRFINPMMFSGLSLLKLIDLSHNNLNDMVAENSSLFERLYENLKHLTEVNLSNNRLTTIPYNMFESNRKLEIIHLSDNLLTQISFHAVNLNNLKTINLERNQIKVLDAASLVRLNVIKDLNNSKYPNGSEGKTLFKLTGNPISCTNCDSLASITWIFHSKSSIENSSLLKCRNEHEQLVGIDQSAIDNVQKICNRPKVIIISCATVATVLVAAIVSFIATRQRRRRKAHELEMADRVALIREGTECYEFVVFLSYSSQDEDFVQKYVYQSLNEHLQKMVGDDRDLICEGDRNFQLGRSIHDQISVLLKKSSVVMVVLTDNYSQSIHCRNEFDQAFMLEKPIVLMVKDQVETALMTPLIRDLYEKRTRVLWLWEDGQYKLKTTLENVCTSIIELVDCK
ncbi:toll-like receptor 4 [Ruditapes philippinarum]|uniref:toll-like receptor 4 n=1 Tax=Ruditapes philippinarum TaxID=129788 RepID=UPI00295BB76F|nr:toll-like receptor 4 [Ruditapes philippinarum]